VACDHYHRFPQDIALMRELGLDSYRFSISWPRIYPSGSGRPNQEGIDFYKRLVSALVEADIEPFVTLYHWDLPQALQDRGGWANRDTVGRFGEYAHTLATQLGDGVHHWITHNEPSVVAFLGHLLGTHPPGTRDLHTALRVSHHLLLSHAEAVEALRAEAREGDQIGISQAVSPVEPAGDSQADAEAARLWDGAVNRWFLDPIYKRSYPEDLLERFGEDALEIQPGDLDRISTPVDFLGVNYYSRTVVRHDPAATPLQAAIVQPEGRPRTDMGWEVYPEGLYQILTRIRDDYSPPAIYITENGAAYSDTLVEGEVSDPLRLRYIHEHLQQAHRAIGEGVPLRGYFVWSLLDNFEWTFGYDKRFGLIYVDYPTQGRIIKESGRWYAGVTRENGVAS
jgi:beta-glucosidase